MRRGQAMVETVLACLFVLSLFLVAFLFLRMETARVLLDHAAARAARARAVGFNDFMCRKSARVAMIPVAGERTWPKFAVDEAARVPIYLEAENDAVANGVLGYRHWETTSIDVSAGGGLSAVASARVVMRTDDFTMDGEAEVESHFQLYMNDEGR